MYDLLEPATVELLSVEPITDALLALWAAGGTLCPAGNQEIQNETRWKFDTLQN